MSEGAHYILEHPKNYECQEDESSLKGDKYYAQNQFKFIKQIGLNVVIAVAVVLVVVVLVVVVVVVVVIVVVVTAAVVVVKYLTAASVDLQ